MYRCKKNFNVKNGINGINFNSVNETIYLYVIVNNYDEIIYVGITKDLISTNNRHFDKLFDNKGYIKIVGEFYDRHLAEFFEITLIKECLSKGCKLINKIIDFNLEKEVNNG